MILNTIYQPRISDELLINFQAHLGGDLSNATVASGSSLLGARNQQLIADFEYFGSLHLVSNLVKLLTNSPKKNNIFIIVHDALLANVLADYAARLNVNISNSLKIIYNYVPGSITSNQSSLYFEQASFMLLLGPYEQMYPIAQEARLARILTCAVVDVKFPGRDIAYPLPGNDNSLALLNFIGEYVIGHLSSAFSVSDFGGKSKVSKVS